MGGGPLDPTFAFPSNPNPGDTYQWGIKKWYWTGTSWTLFGPKTLQSNTGYISVSSTDSTYTIDTTLTPASAATPTTAGTVWGKTTDSWSGQNTALGYTALNAITTGSNNVAVGFETLLYGQTNSSNTAVGVKAMRESSTGVNNVAVGVEALTSNNTGSSSTAIGANSLKQNMGGQNTAVGADSLQASGSGSYNAALGSSAGYSLTSGNYNTLVGAMAGYPLTSGSGNVVIGYYAGPNSDYSNKLYIHNTSGSSPLIAGDFSAQTLTVNGALTATSVATSGGTSDQFLKADGSVDSTNYSPIDPFMLMGA